MWLSNSRKIKHLLVSIRKTRLQFVVNAIKLAFSFYLSRITGNPMIFGTPWALSVEPSGICNLHCPECPVGAGMITRQGGMICVSLFEKIVSEAGNGLQHLNLFFQGEPMLNKQVEQMVSIASHAGLYTTINTNGHYLSPERCINLINSGLTRIVISLDGISSETYSIYRKGGDIDKVKHGIENLISAREKAKSITPFVHVQFLVFKHNEHEIEELKAWCVKAGVDKVELKTAQIYGYGKGEVEPPATAAYSRYTVMPNGTLALKGNLYNHCSRQWGSLVIAWDGRVAPCCYDKNLEFSPGSIAERHLLEIWRGEQLNSFRQKILAGRWSISICSNCPEGTNWLS